MKLWYSKTCLKRPLKKNKKIGFQYRLSLNANKKLLQNAPMGAYCNTFDLLPLRPLFCLFKWPLKTGFTVLIVQSSNEGSTAHVQINKLVRAFAAHIHSLDVDEDWDQNLVQVPWDTSLGISKGFLR